MPRLFLSAVVAMLAAPAVAAPPCSDDDGVDVNDGNYEFRYDSTLEEKGGEYYFLRCIKPISPSKMLFDWTGIAKGKALDSKPITSGRKFPWLSVGVGFANLFYGNADDYVDSAAFVAHKAEAGLGIDFVPAEVQTLIQQGLLDGKDNVAPITNFAELSLETDDNVSFKIEVQSALDSIDPFVARYTIYVEFEDAVEEQYYLNVNDEKLSEYIKEKTGDSLLPIKGGKLSEVFSISGELDSVGDAIASIRSPSREVTLAAIPVALWRLK